MIPTLDDAIIKQTEIDAANQPLLLHLHAQHRRFLGYADHSIAAFLKTVSLEAAPYVAYNAMLRFQLLSGQDRMFDNQDAAESNLFLIHRMAERSLPIASTQMITNIDGMLKHAERHEDSASFIFRKNILQVANDVAAEAPDLVRPVMNYYIRHANDSVAARQSPDLAKKVPGAARPLFETAKDNLEEENFPDFVYSLAALALSAGKPEFAQEVIDKSIAELQNRQARDELTCDTIRVQFGWLAGEKYDVFLPEHLDALTDLTDQAMTRVGTAPCDDATDTVGSYAWMWSELIFNRHPASFSPGQIRRIGDFALSAYDASDKFRKTDVQWRENKQSTDRLITAMNYIRRQSLKIND